MSRHLDGGRLVISSHNIGKVREIGALLAPFGVEAVSAASLGLPEPEETGRDFGHAMARVNEALAQATDRRAHFACALALAWPDGHVEPFEGKVHGCLVWPPRGDSGFGYDPIFVPDGHGLTFGEMEPEAKEAISHRARAFAKLRAVCLGS